MPIKIRKPSETIEVVNRRREFDWRDRPGSGFTFAVDQEGNHISSIEGEPLSPDAIRNWECCLNGTYDVVDRGIVEFRHTYVEPPIGICDCGKDIELGGFTNTCDGCGRDYNWAGQRLASRSQWGEDTGEHLSDILRIQ